MYCPRRSSIPPALLWVGYALVGCLALACHGDDAGTPITRQLVACGLVGVGQLSSPAPISDSEACLTDCRAHADCASLRALYCEQRTTSELRDCQRACAADRPCANGRGSYELKNVCDGVLRCVDGTDERGCEAPRYCQASNVRIQPYQLCNGVADCTDGSDELGCGGGAALFACKSRAGGFAQYVPFERVCDLTRDCMDGSDEGAEQGCAALICR